MNKTDKNETLDSIRQLISSAEYALSSAKAQLDELAGVKAKTKSTPQPLPATNDLPGGQIIEGTFNGEQMIGPDGKPYQVPANYSSKSKLVEGDHLKLTILEDGTFLYKQVGPIERKKVVGVLTDDNGNYTVDVDGKKYKVLYASVTYFRAQPGNKITLVIPAVGDSNWGAIENVLP